MSVPCIANGKQMAVSFSGTNISKVKHLLFIAWFVIISYFEFFISSSQAPKQQDNSDTKFKEQQAQQKLWIWKRLCQRKNFWHGYFIFTTNNDFNGQKIS